jgi:hypothetical protein
MKIRSTKLGVVLLLMAVFVLATFAPAMAATGCLSGSCGNGYVCPTCDNGQCADGQCAPDCPTCDQCGPQGCGSNPLLNQLLQNGRYNGYFGNNSGVLMPFGGGCMSGSCGR